MTDRVMRAIRFRVREFAIRSDGALNPLPRAGEGGVRRAPARWEGEGYGEERSGQGSHPERVRDAAGSLRAQLCIMYPNFNVMYHVPNF